MKVGVGNGGLPTSASPRGQELLHRLEDSLARRGLPSLAAGLAELGELLAGDLDDFERLMPVVPSGHRIVGQSADHLLRQEGKRIRPICVLLAARVGSGVSAAALDLAVAVELVHSATLLHDDVIDHGESRRGTSTARTVYGNAASIFAGDWLLIEALRRVSESGRRHLLPPLWGTIKRMIAAELMQHQNRGNPWVSAGDYFAVISGKTASLFRWAMAAGAAAGSLGGEATDALESYGEDFGIAFQIVDDLLDLTGDPRATGKGLFVDLREGKVSYPLLVTLQRDPTLERLLRWYLACSRSRHHEETALLESIRDRVRGTGAVEDSLATARRHVDAAVAAVRQLSQNRATQALITIAESMVERRF